MTDTTRDSARGGRRMAGGPLFIVGMPRSGTKLLRGLLNRSRSVRILENETHFFPFLVEWVAGQGPPSSREDFERLYVALRRTPYFVNRTLTRPFSWEEWRRHCTGYDASSLFEGFLRYETQTPRSEAILIGDKSPSYIRRIDLLLEHFPEARVIHLVRDVRDYCASTRKAWGKDVRRAAYLWNRDVGRAHASCERKREQCLEVRYEELLRSPDAELQRICAFLGLDYEAHMTELQAPTEHVGSARGRSEVVRTNFGRYAEALTPAEVRDIEALAFEAMHTLGFQPQYARGPRSMTAIERSLRRARDGLQLVLAARARLGVAGALRFHLRHRRMVG